ncbi:MAG: alpha/beta hydrolase, partial [Erysipelotrichaceae bacterium]|nr:alpha/beta hydrolase [Erysipelotrichaceae bacterium]
IGGHSLGGACASMYIDEHRDLFEGLILLASYSTKDLSDSGLSVLSITASNDGILNFDKYTENIRNLPADHIEYQIKGGNHSQFADYGFQKGDGKATIDPEEQLEDVSTAIITFIG